MDLRSRGRDPIKRRVGIFDGIARKREDHLYDDESLDKKVEKLFSSQDLLFERLDSEPKWAKSYRKLKSTARNSAKYIGKQPVIAKVIIVVGLVMLSGGIYGIKYISRDSKSSEISKVAGVVDSSSDPSTEVRTDDPEIDVLSPVGKSLSDLKGVQRSAPGALTIYSFEDYIDNARIEVTQQPIPQDFSQDTSKLEQLAKNSNMTNFFVTDGITVYYGLNEKLGVQSLVFIKSPSLVFIQSEAVFKEATWVGYISNLQ